jgi:hypothetical protein
MKHRNPLGSPPFLQRNKLITIQVLEGSTLEAVALKHGLTRERIRQITFKCVRIITRFDESRHPIVNLASFRADSDRLIKKIEEIQ